MQTRKFHERRRKTNAGHLHAGMQELGADHAMIRRDNPEIQHPMRSGAGN